MVITSPPYWALRDYGVDRQIGLEDNFKEYIYRLCVIFDEIKRVLKNNGTCWVNMGDTYGGHRGSLQSPGGTGGYAKVAMGKQACQNCNLPGTVHKSLSMIPERFAIEMIDRGWILRNQIIWHKPNCMPSSVKDRFTVDFEKIFFFAKSKKYHFEQQIEPHTTSVGPLREKNSEKYKNLPGQFSYGKRTFYGKNGRNKRCVWKICVQPSKYAHFATFPETLIDTPIRAGCPEGGIVLDPFIGTGTTALVAIRQNKKFIGIELNPKYVEIAEKRLLKPIQQQLEIPT